MAHARLGHRAEALRWLGRRPDYQVREGPDRFWEDQRLLIHVREAEAVVRHDMDFPADPFATASGREPIR